MSFVFTRGQVAVEISGQRLRVSADGNQVLGGGLLRAVVPHRSRWQMADGVVEVSLLKARGMMKL